MIMDVGIHYKRWTRKQAYTYRKENLGYGSYELVDLWSALPGYACSYKTGELKILEFRERMKTELGDKFDIKEFHRLILEQGSAPISVLEKRVNRFLLNKKQLSR